ATPYTAGGAALLWSACPLMVSGLKATLEDTADQKTALDSIATAGRRLDLGAAITSCVTGNPGTDTATVSIPAHRLDEYDYGLIRISVAGEPASYYSYNTEYSTAASIAQGLVANFNSAYATATYSSGGDLSLQTVAKGPQTALTAGRAGAERVWPKLRPATAGLHWPDLHAPRVSRNDMQKYTCAPLPLLRLLLIFVVALAPCLLRAQSPAVTMPRAPAVPTAPAIQSHARTPHAVPQKAGPRRANHVLRDVLIGAAFVTVAVFVLWRSLPGQGSGIVHTDSGSMP
ncbi:MAG: hypothetical protein ACRD1Y_06815, partial [Terriglobales bacterium]